MKLREGNDCHNPAGEGGGQFCSAGSSGQTSDRPIPRNRTVDTDKVTLKDIPQKNPLPGTKVSFEGFVKPPWIDRAAELAGNQPGMSVHVSENWEDNPGHYRITFAGTGVTGDLDVDGKDVYFNGLYVAHEGEGRLLSPTYTAEHGTGMKIMAGSILAARELGMTDFSLHAAGESGRPAGYGNMVGYSAWPRLGFDGKIPGDLAWEAETYFGLPKDSLKSVQDIFDIPEIPRGTIDDEGSDLARSSGRVWWREQGSGFRGRFDLKSGSRSMKRLTSYMKHRFGMEINEANDCHNPAGSSKGGQFCSTPEPEDVFAQERFGSHAPGVTDQGRAFRDDLRKLAASLGHEVITMRDASDIYNFWHKMTSGSDADRAQWTATATAWAERNRNPRSVAARRRAAKKQAGRYWVNATGAVLGEAVETLVEDICREPAGVPEGGQFASCAGGGVPSEGGTATAEPEVQEYPRTTEAQDMDRAIEKFLPGWTEHYSADADMRVFRPADSPMDSPFVKIDHRFWTNPEGSHFERQNAKGYLYAQMQNIAEMNQLAGGALQNVVFTLDPNPDDPYWNGVYGLTGFQSAASANSADGTVTFYGPTMVRGEGRARETFTHEVGHLVSLMGTNDMRADPDTRAELDQLGSRYEALFDEASKAKWGEAGMGNRATNYGSLTSYGSMNWKEDFAELYKLAHIPLTQAEKDRYPVMRTRELAKELKPSNQLEAAIMDMGSRIWQVGGEWKDLVVPHHLTSRIDIANRLAGKDLVDPAFMARLRRWAADENPKLKDWWKQSPTPEEHIVAIGLERGRELMAEAVEQIAGDLCRSEIGQFASCAHGGATTAEAPEARVAPETTSRLAYAEMVRSSAAFLEPRGYKLAPRMSDDGALVFRKDGMPDIEIAKDAQNLEGLEKIIFIASLNKHLFLVDEMHALSGNSITRIYFAAGSAPEEVPGAGFTIYAHADGNTGSLGFFNLAHPELAAPDTQRTFTHEVGHLVSIFGRPEWRKGERARDNLMTLQLEYKEQFTDAHAHGFGWSSRGGFTPYGSTNWREDFAENFMLAHQPVRVSEDNPNQKLFNPVNELENRVANYTIGGQFGKEGIPPYIRRRMEIMNKLASKELVRASFLNDLDAWLKAHPGQLPESIMREVMALIEREYCRDEKGRFSSGPCDEEGEGGTATATATEEKPKTTIVSRSVGGKEMTPEEWKAYQDAEFKQRMEYRANATEVMTKRGYTFEPGFDTDSAMVFSKPGSPSIIIARDSLSIKPGSEKEKEYFAEVNKHLDMIPQMQELGGGSIRWLRFSASEDPDSIFMGQFGVVLAKATVANGGISFFNLAEPAMRAGDTSGTFVHEVGHLVNLFGTDAARGGLESSLQAPDIIHVPPDDPAALAARAEARKMQAQYDMAFGTAKRANFGVDGVAFGHDTRGGFTAYGSTNAGEDFAENFRLAHEPVNTEALTERGKEIFREFKPANELEMSIGKFLVDIQDTVPYHVRARMEALNALTGRELVRKSFLEDLDKYLKAHAIDAAAWNESIEVIAGNLCRSEVGQWAACDVGAETATTATSASPRVETEATKLPPELYAKVARVSPGQGSEVKLTSREIKEVLHDGTYGIIGAGRSPLDRDWTPEKERQRFDAIIAEAKAKGYRYMEAKGRYGQDEPSVFVFIPEAQKSDIIEMGKRFNQDSVIFGKEGKQRMVFTTGEKVGKGHPGRGYKNIVSTQQLDFFTEIPATDGPYKFALKFNFNRLVERLRKMFAPEILNEFIRKVSGGYRVVSHQTGKNFGTYKSREAAKRRLKQMARFR